MKKIFIVVFALLSISVAANAQEAASKKASGGKMKAVTTQNDKRHTTKVIPMTNDAGTNTTASTTQTAESTPLKKDGTPDKRYTKNKTSTVLKKDGTPDMRYKENKAKPKS